MISIHALAVAGRSAGHAAVAVLLASGLSPAAAAQEGHHAEGGVPLEWTHSWGANQAGEDYADGVLVRGDRLFGLIAPNGIGYCVPGTIVCLDVASGLEHWREKTYYLGASHLSTPEIAFDVSRDGSLVVVVQRGTPELTPPSSHTPAYGLKSIRADTGDVLLETELLLPDGADLSNPLMAVAHDGSAVYVAGSGWTAASGFEYWLKATDPITGGLLWQFSTISITGPSNSPVALTLSETGAHVYLASRQVPDASHSTLEVTAFDASTGALAWSRVLNADFQATQHLVLGQDPGSGLLVAAMQTNAGDSVFALDPLTGVPAWTASVGGQIHTLGLAAAGGRIFVGSSPTKIENDARVTALDASTGVATWSVDYDGPMSGDYDQPMALRVLNDGRRVLAAVVAENLLLGSRERSLLMVDAANGALLWSTIYDQESVFVWEEPGERAIAVSTDETLVIAPRAGENEVHPTSQADAVFGAYSLAAGAAHWSVAYDVEVGHGEEARAAAFSGDGSILIVAGGPVGLFGADTLTMGLHAATGAQLWLRQDGGGQGASTLLAHPDSQRIFQLEPFGSVNWISPRIRSLAPQNGDLLWSTEIAADYKSSASFALGLSPAGDRLVCAGSRNGPHFVVLDTNNGVPLWQASNAFSMPLDAVVWTGFTDDGSQVLLAGYRIGGGTLSGGSPDASLVIARDAKTGALSWIDETLGTDSLKGWTRHVTAAAKANGVLVLAERVGSGYKDADLVVRALDSASGAQLWERFVTYGNQSATAIAIEATGDRILVGAHLDTTAPADKGLFAFALDPSTGAMLWQDFYNTPDSELAADGELSLDGSTWILTGQTIIQGPAISESDMLTIAYDAATGQRLWIANWDGAFLDEPLALAFHPTGQCLALAGLSAANGELPDIAVVSYGTPALLADPPEVSIGGGSQTLTLRAGSAHAGQLHLVLGSASGDFPGTPLGSAILPLNVDEYLILTAAQPGVPIDGALGQLSETGAANASFVLPAGAPSSLIGKTLHHAYVAIDVAGIHPVLSLVSNAVAVQIGP